MQVLDWLLVLGTTVCGVGRSKLLYSDGKAACRLVERALMVHLSLLCPPPPPSRAPIRSDLGCHIDGYIAVVAQTIIVPPEEGEGEWGGCNFLQWQRV